MLCVDFSKAFDSIEHNVIRSSLTFFNFGDNIMNMVMTILKDRKARVILDGSYSDTLQIQRGTPQGDRASPFIFIIVMEILLIKLVYKDGGGINSLNYISDWLNGIDIESTTAEVYADDLTIIFKMCQEGVTEKLRVLEDFTAVTGLEVNKGKTQLMVTGGENWGIGGSVEGIRIVETVTLLGIKIDRKLENWIKIGRIKLII